jgi:hypothetical protein
LSATHARKLEAGIVAVMLTLSACAAPLDVQKSSASAAPVVGVPASQIQFIAYCDFGDVPPGEKHPGQNGGNGLIVLTNDSIYLLQGSELPIAKVKRRIRYREIDGVDVRHMIRAYQLQLSRGDIITVMVITKNKALIDRELTERAAEILREHGVPSWRSPKYYAPKIPPPTVIPIPIPIPR